jgi:dsRNA-specific ribonuclease
VGWLAIGSSIFATNIGSEHIVGLAGSEGPPHARTFIVEANVPGWAPTRGSGASKKEAETAAAGGMLSRLDDAGEDV